MSPPSPSSPESALPESAPAKPRRPRLQFSLLGLMVLMLFGSMVGAILFYFVRGWQTNDQSLKLIGMVFVLAGPLLLTILISLLVAVAQRVRR